MSEEKDMTNKEYLDSIVQELMADEEWELPPEQRFFLAADLEWSLLGL